MPSPTMATTCPPPSAAPPLGLVPGSTSAKTRAMPSSWATASAVPRCRRSASSFDPAASVRDRLVGTCLTYRQGDQPRTRAPARLGARHGAALGCQFGLLGVQRLAGRPFPSGRGCRAAATAVDRSGDALAGIALNASASGSRSRARAWARPPRQVDVRCPAAAAPSAAAGRPRHARGRDEVGHPACLGQRAGLVEALVSTRWRHSSASPSLIRMPYSAALPVPTMMAVGVARPSAQGQAMTSTRHRRQIAKVRVTADGQPADEGQQPPSPTRPARRSALTLSASALDRRLGRLGALHQRGRSAPASVYPDACVSTVSEPADVDRRAVTSRPPPLSPAGSRRSACTHRRSRCLRRAAIDWHLSPGRTATISPTRTVSTGMSCSTPSRMTRAVLACRPISARMAVRSGSWRAIPSSCRAG